MPLLLGWCQAPHRHVQLAALSALLQAVRLTWPRIPVHAAVLWRVLRRVHGEEIKRRWAGVGWWLGRVRGRWGFLLPSL